MNVGYHTPGAFFPHRPLTYGLVPPSPTPSVCSEPIYQVTLPNSRCPSPGIQMMTPKMSFMNPATVGVSGWNNMIGKLPTHVKQPDVTNIFQLGSSFSGQFSESESSVYGGRMSMSSQNQITPSYCFLQTDSAPSDYTMSDKPSVNSNLMKSLKSQSYATGWRQNERRDKQEQDDTGSGSSGWDSTWGRMYQAQQKDKSIKIYVTAPEKVSALPDFKQSQAKDGSSSKSAHSGSKSDRSQDIDGYKKELIEKSKDVKNEKEVKNDAIRKRKLQVRKHRKKVQKKNKSLHKTELCTHWTLTSTCSYQGKCYFAHGINELKKRSRGGNYKTQPCVECPIEESRCLFGSRCNYCHPGEAIRQVVGSTYYDKDYYKDLKKEFSDNDYPFGIFV